MGLIGLQGIITDIKKGIETGSIDIETAPEEMLILLERKNYIPAKRREDYLHALAKLIREEMDTEEKELASQSGGENALVIRILGPGCSGCNMLEEMVMSAMSSMNIAADIYHVTDHDEIWRFGVTKTPALIIGEKLLCSGRMPTRFQIEEWIRAAIAE